MLRYSFLFAAVFQSVLAAAQPARAQALADSAYNLLEVKPDDAHRLARQAMVMAREEKSDKALHDALNCIRYVHYLNGQHADQLERSVEALSVAQRMGSERAMGDDHGWISVALFNSGQKDRAFEHARLALEHMRATNDTTAITRGLSDMANASNIVGKRGEAIMHIDEAIRLYEAIGDSSGSAFAQNVLAAYYMEAKRWSSALPYLRKAHGYIGRNGTEVEKIWAEGDLGRTCAHLGLFDEARTWLESAERRIALVGALRERPRLLHSWIAFHEAQGHYQEALGTSMRLVELNDSIFKAEAPDRVARSTAAHELERAYEERGRLNAELQQALAGSEQLQTQRNGALLVCLGLLAGLVVTLLLIHRSGLANAKLTAELEAALDEEDRRRGHKLDVPAVPPLRKVD